MNGLNSNGSNTGEGIGKSRSPEERATRLCGDEAVCGFHYV